MQDAGTVEGLKFAGEVNVLLSHFAARDIEPPHSVEQRVDTGHKPRGLWVSVESDWGWKRWCRSENFLYPEGFRYHYRVKLHADARIAVINDDNVLAFHEHYRDHGADPLWEHNIDWYRVAKEYQGILIPHYMWQWRHGMPVSDWYYGWDCASGCIWDADAIKSVRRLKR